MNLKILLHHDDAGFWAEVPAIPGCVSQGDSMDELLANIREAIEGCLGICIENPIPPGSNAREITIAV